MDLAPSAVASVADEALFGAGAGADRQRQHPTHQRERRHEDRAQPVAVALDVVTPFPHL